MVKRKRRTFTAEFKAEVVLQTLRRENSAAELCRRHNLSEYQLLKWKQQFLENAASVFASTDKPVSEAETERIAHLEQRVGRLTVVLDIQKSIEEIRRNTPSKYKRRCRYENLTMVGTYTRQRGSIEGSPEVHRRKYEHRIRNQRH